MDSLRNTVEGSSRRPCRSLVAEYEVDQNEAMFAAREALTGRLGFAVDMGGP